MKRREGTSMFEKKKTNFTDCLYTNVKTIKHGIYNSSTYPVTQFDIGSMDQKSECENYEYIELYLA